MREKTLLAIVHTAMTVASVATGVAAAAMAMLKQSEGPAVVGRAKSVLTFEEEP